MTIPVEERERFVDWLAQRAIHDARGDRVTRLPVKPSDRLWLGRVAPEESAMHVALGERGKRLDPCAIGMRFQPTEWTWTCRVGFVIWTRQEVDDRKEWVKSARAEATFEISMPPAETNEAVPFGRSEITAALRGVGSEVHGARVEVTVEMDRDRLVAEATLVNESPAEKRGHDTNLYETVLELDVGRVETIELDALPDSFRYDRRVPALGVSGSVEYDGRTLRTTDFGVADRRRPTYFDHRVAGLDLTFSSLASDPLPALRCLVAALEEWGDSEWGEAALAVLAAENGWTDEMAAFADKEAGKFRSEVEHCRAGLRLLESDSHALEAFRLMNEAFEHSGRSRYTDWRPFQLGFVLTALPSLLSPGDTRRETVDTLWFATGGGKTETYLALVVLLAIYDRLTGKRHGVSAWSRFPLRMLSLQQTQRFADALAGAELARHRHGIPGDPIALGFFVGGPPSGTPNRIRDDDDNPAARANNREMPELHQVLLRCPFCFSEDLQMRFDRQTWRLMHVCTNERCVWQEVCRPSSGGEPQQGVQKDAAARRRLVGLPFHVVDEEIYRFLPTVVIGTLDKAASVAFQAANRGLYASPLGRCQGPGHGFTYAPRSKNPTGCLVPDCSFGLAAIEQDLDRFAPSLRIQDELHLLRDTLGAVDSHYETLLDHLYRATRTPVAKLVASSATLAGYEHQVETLYGRKGSAFPLPGPLVGRSFWTRDSEELARRFVGLAPRGVTLEFANDRLAESLQRAVRCLLDDPETVCAQAGVDPQHRIELLGDYGVHVVYGTKLRDVEAAARSFDTQPGVAPLNVATLTGRNTLDEVRRALARLDAPEPEFMDRLHVVCASSMMSHGVDVDRFNVITLLGLPLSTAEFIQTSARIGRRHPGLVFVLHRMGVERDASVFRSFTKYVEHGDRFVEPIAITRRSRRVLEYTFPGLFMARVLGVHEARSVRFDNKRLTTVRALREYFTGKPVLEEDEFEQLVDALHLGDDPDSPLRPELRRLLRRTYAEVLDPATRAEYPRQATPREPMRSLREVETQVPIIGELS